MAVAAQEVNKLRRMTGAGMMDCKKALTEANGDFDKSIEFLRKKGQKVSASRADRKTSEGIVYSKTNADNTEGIIVTLTCETDFVAKNKEFVALGDAITDIAFVEKPASIDALMKLPMDGLTVGDQIMEMTGKIGEKLAISVFELVSGETVVPYMHSNMKLGVLVVLKNVNGTDVVDAGTNVAMQIAAMNPMAVDKDGVDPSIVEKEINIGKEQARQEGKPEALVEKIATGKLKKFFSENTLLSQQFVKDGSISISQYLDGVRTGLTIADFKRVAIG